MLVLDAAVAGMPFAGAGNFSYPSRSKKLALDRLLWYYIQNTSI
jgi:hypothetical protein